MTTLGTKLLKVFVNLESIQFVTWLAITWFHFITAEFANANGKPVYCNTTCAILNENDIKLGKQQVHR